MNIVLVVVANHKHYIESSIFVYDQHEVEFEIKTQCFEDGCIVHSRFDSETKQTGNAKEKTAAERAKT